MKITFFFKIQRSFIPDNIQINISIEQQLVFPMEVHSHGILNFNGQGNVPLFRSIKRNEGNAGLCSEE